LTGEEANRRRNAGGATVADLIEELLADGSRSEGLFYDVLLLSGPDEPDTVCLDHLVENDTVAASGRKCAWTLQHRYTQLSRLGSGVTRTSQL
jgi:hypothetical protein